MYLAIGRSHFSLLEMVRGSMKDAVVRLVCSLHELVDICIESSTRKVLSVIVQTDKKLENCEVMVGYLLHNRPGRTVYKLLLQFATAQTCLEAERCIMVARGKDLEKRDRDVNVAESIDCRSKPCSHTTRICMLLSPKLRILLATSSLCFSIVFSPSHPSEISSSLREPVCLQPNNRMKQEND